MLAHNSRQPWSWLIFNVGRRNPMNIAKILLGETKKEKIKVKAHAVTLFSVMWFFFSLLAVMFFRDGLITKHYAECIIAVAVWVLHVALIILAVVLWVIEKKREALMIETSVDIGMGPMI